MNTHRISCWRKWLALKRHLPDAVLLRLLKYSKEPDAILKTPARLLAQKLKLQNITIKPDWNYADTQLEALIRENAHFITWTDTDYPPQLRQISKPPPFLFAKGNKAALLRPQIAIVGSRTPSLEGIKTAYTMSQACAKAGLVITSGLAYGIDKICHQGALALSSPTVAVLGSGLDIVYPSQHQMLAQYIEKQHGVLLSEFAFNTPPLAAHFPRRNRIISGLSLGTLVVEAALRSGSLITARYALEQNREVFAVPGSLYNPLSTGCHHLLQQGAKLVTTVQDILEELRL